MFTTSKTIQDALIELRGEDEQQELAQRFAEAGIPLSSSTISHLENGRRRVAGRSLAAYRKLFELKGEAALRFQALADAQFFDAQQVA